MDNILASSSFLIINKVVLQEIGVDASIVLSHLVHRELYYKKVDRIKDGYFYNTTVTISCATTLSYYQIKQAIETLKKYKFITCVRKGIPARLFFKINTNQLSNFLRTSNEVTNQLDCELAENKIYKNPNEVINNKVIKKNYSINTRQESFKEECSLVDKSISKDKINDFIDYWTETNSTGKKMRFELEKTWSTPLRLKRWVRHHKNFSKGSSANNMPDFLDNAYLNRIKDDSAQVNKYYSWLVESCGYEKYETVTGYIKYRKKR